VALALGLLALAVFAASCSSGDSSDSKSSSKTTTSVATQVAGEAAVKPVGAETAVAAYLKDQGLEYAGDCANASLPRDKGKWCSTLVSGADSNEQKVYGIGPVGQKPEKQITITRHGSAQLTPGYQVPVGGGNVGTPQELTGDQLAANAFITGNLILDQQAGIGNGLGDLPAGAPNATPETGGGGPATTAPPATTTPPITNTSPDTGVGEYPPTGSIVVDNPNVLVAGEAVFHGSGCSANEPLTIRFDGQEIGTISADPQGAFAGSLSIPPGTAPGAHSLTVRGANCVFNSSINVTGAKLAFTGSSNHTTSYVLGGIAAIVLGFVLVVSARRRKNRRHRRRLPPPAATA
jgi:LPXTG-motif cell wall-anchored protein